MTGSSIFDYVHHQDHAEIAEQLGLGLASNQSMASPSSGISEDGGANQGTNNPDGNFDLNITHLDDFSTDACHFLSVLLCGVVASVMTISSQNSYKGFERAFCVRMKSTLTKRGCHFKSSGYRVRTDLIAIHLMAGSHEIKNEFDSHALSDKMKNI